MDTLALRAHNSRGQQQPRCGCPRLLCASAVRCVCKGSPARGPVWQTFLRARLLETAQYSLVRETVFHRGELCTFQGHCAILLLRARSFGHLR